LFIVADARAGTFDVSPLRVHLSASKKSAVVTVHNTSDEALRFEVTGFAWEQDAEGKMQLQPTQDVLFFPALLSIEPGKSRNLRVGTTTSFGAGEKTYRIFVAQMPPLERKGGGLTTGVRVLTRLGIPVFLEPESTTPAARLDGLAVRKRHLTMQLKNTGNVHLFVTQIHLIGKGADGKVRFEKKSQGWYVLGGGVRDYDVELPSECEQASEVRVRIETDPPSLITEATVPVSSAACSP
jgi:fimbrial chaperone protein